MTETTMAGPGLQLSNGDHVCVFCRGGERDELLVPFLSDGLSAGDRCLAVVDTSEPEELLDALGTGGGAAQRADQLTVLASRLGAEHSEVQGTGIGLVLAKRLAEAMGGALTVDSAEGQEPPSPSSCPWQGSPPDRRRGVQLLRAQPTVIRG